MPMQLKHLENYIKTFLKIIDSTKTDSASSFWAFFCIFCYFSQILSYIFKFKYSFDDEKLTFIAKIVLYSNFSNLMLYFQKSILVWVTFFLALFSALNFYFYVFLLTILGSRLQKMSFFNKIIGSLNWSFAFNLKAYFWIFILPSLEIFINPLKCGISGSYFSCDDIFPIEFTILSIFSCIISIFVGYAYLFLYKDYFFLDLNEIKPRGNFINILVYILRVFLPILFAVFDGDYQEAFYVLIFIILALSFCDYLQNFHIRSPLLNKTYIMSLMFTIAFTFSNFFGKYSNFFDEKSIFAVFFSFGLIASKFGLSIYRRKYYDILVGNLCLKGFVDFSLEEILLLFNLHKCSIESHFMFIGMIKYHAKSCKNKKCKINENHMKNFENLNIFQQEEKLSGFILQKLSQEINKDKRNSQTKEGERLFFKYISHLINSNLNCSKAFYEIQRIISTFPSKSMLNQIFLKVLLHKIHAKINEIEKERRITQIKSDEDKSLDTISFFKINKHKLRLEKQTKKLLKAKISFWERYKEGYNSYEEIISDLFKFIKHTFNYEKKLERSISETSKDNIVSLKFGSLFYCIIYNQLHVAIKLEDEIENVKKKFIKTQRDSLSPLSFLEDNFITCEASFLNQGGLILEKSKTEKLGQFFGYKPDEIKLIKKVTEFMPNNVSNLHDRFFNWGFKKTHKEQVTSKMQIITFGLDKNHFVFPLKIQLGHNLHHFDDFVMHAALMKINSNFNEGILFQKNGMIMGINEVFFKCFLEITPKLDVSSLEYLNIYCLVPKLKELIEANPEESSLILRNSNGVFRFPVNLVEIIEVLKFKKEQIDQDQEKQANSFISSMRSFKTFNSSRSKTDMASKKSERTGQLSTKIRSFFSKYSKSCSDNGHLNSKREILEKIFEEGHDPFNEKVMTSLLESNKMKKRKMNFDISFKTYRYGKQIEDTITICWLKINQLGDLEEENFIKPITQVEETFISEMSIKMMQLPPDNNVKFDKELFERECIRSMFSAQNDNNISIKIDNTDRQNQENHDNFENNQMINTKDKEKGNIISIKGELSHVRASESSEKSKENARLEKLKGETTDNGNMLINMENTSQKASSVSTLKKSYAIFNIIKFIQNKLPLSIRLIIVSLFFQIMLIFLYCIIIYFFATNYIVKTYEPLQDANINQCRTNIGIDLAGLIFNEYEYNAYGFYNFTNFEKTELQRILKICFENSKDLFYSDRNKEYSFGFADYLQKLNVKFVDYRSPSEVETILISDMNDIFLQQINNIMNMDDYRNFVDILKSFFRNFFYYTQGVRSIRDQIQQEFVNSIDITSNNVVLIMILMMILVSLIKLSEFYVFSSYYMKITKLINIFLRITAKEAINELNVAKEILNILENPKISYLHIHYPDKYLTKNEINIDEGEIEQLNLSKKKKAMRDKKNKNIKKISLYNLRNISKSRVYIFIGCTFVIGIGYFFSNYYFWTLSATNVSNLLQINVLFNNLYIFSTTAVNYQRFLIREKVISDSEYANNPDYYQNHDNRLKLFASALAQRIQNLNSYITETPKYALAAQTYIKDPLFDNLVAGDGCDTLKVFAVITDEQMPFCQEVFNQGFKNGLFTTLKEFTTNLTNNQFSNLIDKSDTTAINAEILDIEKYLKEYGHTGVIIGDYYLSEMLFIFYNYLKDYYSGILQQQIWNLQTFVWITCIAFSLFMAIIAWYSWKYLTSVYLHITWSLALIPNEKLSNDEQSIFLIKQFWKESS